MPSFFSRLKGKDGASKASKKKGAQQPDISQLPPQPQWEDAWTRKTVEPEEVQELLRGCTTELKSRAMDIPLSLLPFRPTSDPSAARTFIRHFFDRNHGLHGEGLAQELRLTEPMVLCSVVKWCWSRLPGGVVTWDAYELFRVGESDSSMARDAFATFIPLSVDSDARTKIIFDFFDLLSAIVAHAKTNGFGGRKLSRLAGWWAFEHNDNKNGFEGGYKSWVAAADAASHLFFAYLRSLSPLSVSGLNGISSLPISLQKLLQETEYPPERPTLLQSSTTKVVMIVDSVSPTPFALLRRANHFQYRDDDRALQEFAEYEDPVKALTDECRRVLRCISTANQSQVSTSKNSTGLRDASWSRFEDIGFSGGIDENEEEDEESNFLKRRSHPRGLRTTPHPSSMGLARPTTPSWADFLSSGFVDEGKAGPAPLLLPPDKILPPIDTRGRSSQSHRPRLETDHNLEPGELANIIKFDLDDSFWWVWITSLAGEETPERKAAFGRCALVETQIRGGRWLVMEEVVKGAAAEPEAGAYIAEKKSFWGRSRKSKRRKSAGKEALEKNGALQPFKTSQSNGTSKISVGPDQHARIQAAAIQLQQRQRLQEAEQAKGPRRGRNDTDTASHKTNSVLTLQPVIMSEASPAMKWANKYDKDAIREAYLANSTTGKGAAETKTYTNGHNTKSQDTLRPAQNPQRDSSRDRDLPAVPPSAGPAVPAKASPPPAASAAPAPIRKDNKEQASLSEKATEAALSAGPHPALAGSSVTPSTLPSAKQPSQPSPAPPIEQHPAVARSASPIPPAGQPSLDITRPSEDAAHADGSSPESKNKHNKLRKKEVSSEPRGFRKMFSRKNRQSTAPGNAPEALSGGQGGLQPGQSGGIGRRLSQLRKKTPPASPAAEPPSSEQISENEITPVASPQPPFERSYDPSVQESLSRVDTNDAREAHQAFSNFDQGPLDDVPAFVPDSPAISDDSAAPPNISRSHEPEDTTSPLTQEVSPPQDRWAQIRKNAAERAAVRQSEEQSRGGQSQKTDGDDGETSGEETIESRVARIKARVAELTGNMESNGSPTNQASPRKPTGF